MNEQDMCFACGLKNPIGLKLDFEREGNRVWTEFTPGEYHQGYPGIMHGGLVTTLMDEAMAKVVNFRGIKAVTATLDVKFRNPVPIGGRLKVFGELTDEKTRRCSIKAWVEDERGVVLAESTSVFIKL